LITQIPLLVAEIVRVSVEPELTAQPLAVLVPSTTKVMPESTVSLERETV
jgi:hypothetical protein